MNRIRSRRWAVAVRAFVFGLAFLCFHSSKTLADELSAAKPVRGTDGHATDLIVTPAGFPLQPWGTPNKQVDINDVFSIILGFQGVEYPGSEIELCTDP